MHNCLAMDQEEGCPEARKLLKQRYGQSYKITTAQVDKVTKGPAIKIENRIAELCHLADKLQKHFEKYWLQQQD